MGFSLDIMSKVSVIIPSYKASKYLSDAIESVLKQIVSNGRSVECIVVIDGSPENDYEVAMQYSPHIKVVSQDNRGVNFARNAGAKLANGDYLIFLDADDWLTNDAVESRLDILQSDKDAVIVHGLCTHVNEIGEPISVDWHWPEGANAEGDMLERLLRSASIQMPSVMIEREAYLKAGGFDEDYPIQAGEEFLLWLRVAEFGKFRFQQKITAVYRHRASQASKNNRLMVYGDFLARHYFFTKGRTKSTKVGSHKRNLIMTEIALQNGTVLEKMGHPGDSLKIYFTCLLHYFGTHSYRFGKPLLRSMLSKLISH